jgi:hypothetical protein
MEQVGTSASSLEPTATPNPQQELTSPASAWVDEVTTVAPTTPGDMSSPKFSAPDWKITIQNRDGSTSEVNMRDREIRISMIEDKTTKNSTEEPEVENPDTSKEVSVSNIRGIRCSKLTYGTQKSNLRKETIWAIGQHVLTASSAVAIIAISILTLTTYMKTKHIGAAWPEVAKLSPTIVMLSIACLTATADVITVCIHFCHGRSAATAKRMVHHILSAMAILQAVAGAASAGFFKSSKNTSNGSDLWGWACSAAADKMGTVNSSGTLCSGNVCFNFPTTQRTLRKCLCPLR